MYNYICINVNITNRDEKLLINISSNVVYKSEYVAMNYL